MFECYHWRPADNAVLDAAGWTLEAQKKHCGETLGHVYSQGDQSKAPGCGTCWCCSRVIKGGWCWIFIENCTFNNSEEAEKFWCNVEKGEDCGDLKQGRSFQACSSGQLTGQTHN